MPILHIIENLLIIYYVAYFLMEMLLILIFLVIWRRESKSAARAKYDDDELGISVLVPAYNEEVTIADCVQNLTSLNYHPYEIIVVSDGSTDKTLEKLKAAFQLEEFHLDYNDSLGTLKIERAFKSPAYTALKVIEKRNGGKADALNVGLNLAKYPYVCTLDADSILDPDALDLSAAVFREDKEAAVAISGGALAVANEARLIRKKAQTGRFPRNLWVLFQVVEYLRSFIVSRTGLSKIGGLLIMSGAFTLFRRETLREAGGFLSPYNRHPYLKKIGLKGAGTVCEDLEVVVRVRRCLREKNQFDRVKYNPRPICWTEVPSTLKNLSRQRNRWHRGLLETLILHRKLFFEPGYGTLGILALPYYLFFEALSPLVRVFTYGFLAVLIAFGLVDRAIMALLILAVALTTTIFMALITVMVEKWSAAHSPVNLRAMRYNSIFDWLKLLTVSIAGDFTFAQLRLVWQLKGIYSLIKGKKSWDKFSRNGFND